ncbi:MAG: hypothetical protein ABF239_01940 [Wenyingzhuangia sp.]
MINPMPIDELTSFLEQNNNVKLPDSSPWLRYALVGGILIMAIGIPVVIYLKQNQNSNLLKQEEYGN